MSQNTGWRGVAKGFEKGRGLSYITRRDKRQYLSSNLGIRLRSIIDHFVCPKPTVKLRSSVRNDKLMWRIRNNFWVWGKQISQQCYHEWKWRNAEKPVEFELQNCDCSFHFSRVNVWLSRKGDCNVARSLRLKTTIHSSLVFGRVTALFLPLTGGKRDVCNSKVHTHTALQPHYTVQASLTDRNPIGRGEETDISEKKRRDILPKLIARFASLFYI